MKINNIHTDNCKVYNKIPKKYNHTTSKNQTTQVESFNSILRTIPCLVRKTNAFNKSFDSLFKKLNVFLHFFNKNVRNFLTFTNYYNIFVSDNNENMLKFKHN